MPKKKTTPAAKMDRKAGAKVEPRKAPPPTSPFELGRMGVAPKE